MRVAWPAVLGWVCVVALFVEQSRNGTAAESENADIVWNAERGCPSREIFIEKIVDILGEMPVVGETRRFVGSAARQGEKWRATLETQGEGQVFSRTVLVGSCEAATEVVSLLVALAVDPMSVLSSEDEGIQASLKTLSETDREPSTAEEETVPKEGASEPSPETRVSEQAPQTPPPPVQEGTTELPRERWGHIGIDFDADVGTDGGFRPGCALFGGFLWKLLRIEASARYLPRREASVEGVPGGRYKSRLVGFSLGIGLQWRLGRFRIGPAAGGALHGLFAESSGVAAPGTGTAWFASLWAGGHLEWLVNTRFGLRFFPSVHYLPEQPQFDIEGVGTVMQPSFVTGSFRLGVFLHF